MALGEVAEAGGRERLGGQLIAHPLGQQVVARVLHQQGDAAAALQAPAGRLREAGEEPQQRRLARAVAAHQRHPLAWREGEIDAAQDGRAAL